MATDLLDELLQFLLGEHVVNDLAPLAGDGDKLDCGVASGRKEEDDSMDNTNQPRRPT